METPAEQPTKKIAFFATMAPGDTPRLETMLGYALVAAAMKYEMKIFFALDSALVTKSQIFDKLEAKVRDRIRECVKEGVQVEVCSASAKTFNIRPEDLIDGATIKGIASFYDYAENADITLSWS